MKTADTVDQLIAALDHPRKPAIEAVRNIILAADPRITEAVKWNAPSFLIDDHFATFKLAPRDTFQVIFHTGARKRATPAKIKIDDPSGLLKWAADDRCVASFADAGAVESKRSEIVSIVRQWISQLYGG